MTAQTCRRRPRSRVALHSAAASLPQRLTSSYSAACGAQRRERGRRTLVSVTVEVDVADPCAAVFASRLASDRWFCWEQPDRGVRAGRARGRARGRLARREPLRRRRRASACGPGTTRSSSEPRGLPAGRRAGLARRLRLRSRGRRLLDLVLAAAGLAGPAGALDLPQRRAQPSSPSTRSSGRARTPSGRARGLEARLAGLRAEAPLPLLDPHPTARGGDPQRPPARPSSKPRWPRPQRGSRRGR